MKVLYNNVVMIDDVQFQREFENLMRLEHHNIVRLVGYCYETQHQPIQHMGGIVFAEMTYKALCFEYMQNGSLEEHLSGTMFLYFFCFNNMVLYLRYVAYRVNEYDCIYFDFIDVF